MNEVSQRTDREVLEAHIVSPEFRLATLTLLQDVPPGQVDAVFFFGRSYFDAGKNDLFQVAADLVKQRAGKIFLADSEGEKTGETIPRIANPGKTLWTDRLNRLGVGKDQIEYCPHPQGEAGFHTRSEAEAFVKTAAKNGFKKAVIIAQPHQITRAMLSVIKVINDLKIELDVWCMTPRETDWNKKVMGSQGMELKPRSEHIQDEIDRIFKYQGTEELASFEELSVYLAKRDNKYLKNL